MYMMDDQQKNKLLLECNLIKSIYLMSFASSSEDQHTPPPTPASKR
jgi:hypothetical protein